MWIQAFSFSKLAAVSCSPDGYRFRWAGIWVWDDGQAGPCMGLVHGCMAWCMAFGGCSISLGVPEPVTWLMGGCYMKAQNAMHHPCTHAPDPCTAQLACRPRPKSRPSWTSTHPDYMILLLAILNRNTFNGWLLWEIETPICFWKSTCVGNYWWVQWNKVIWLICNEQTQMSVVEV